MLDLVSAAPAAATLPLFLPQAPPDKVSGLIHAATLLAQLLGQGRAIDSRALRSAMETAFCASDAEGAWVWKDAYEALEAAQVMFLRKFGAAMRTRAGSAAAMLEMLTRLAARLPTQTRRSEESEHLQQFSTPITLGFVAAEAAALTSADLVLEPSAGTGLLAIFAEFAKARLALNEIADTRAGLLGRLFRGIEVSRHNAEQIHDRLDPAIRPSVVLMNPPFSASPDIGVRFAEAAIRHVRSAFARLAEGGRLVAITGHNLAPDNPACRDSFIELQQKGRVVFTAAIAGRAYVRHGTNFETRLTVIDRVPAEDPRSFPPVARHCGATPPNCSAGFRVWYQSGRRLSTRPRSRPSPCSFDRRRCARKRQRRSFRSPNARRPVPDAAELVYETRDWTPASHFSAGLYEGYALQTINFADAPAASDQAGAVGGHGGGRPSPPLLPANAAAAVCSSSGILSDAQLESVVYAGEAHASHLAGTYTVDETYDLVSAAPADAKDAVRFRRGWFLGDGTGAGKGRQVAAIILDNWLRGRRKALWISKSDKLIEDAERDWTAIGGYRSDIVPLSRFRQGARRSRLEEGILFTTYATLRTQAQAATRSAVSSRSSTGLAANSTASSSLTRRTRWPTPPATRASAAKRNRRSRARPDCACSTRCTTRGCSTSRRPARRPCRTSPMPPGSALWGTGDFPFATRADFVAAMEKGGVAAMEVLARDLKALGLYAARSLSFEGIEYEIVEHTLTQEQIRIYDAYADAFQIIHRNLTEALKAANITGESGATYNRNAKAAARSAFEANKQRFFNHLLTAMKCPTLIAAIARDLEEGHACVSCRSSRPTRRCSTAASPRSRPPNGAISRSTSRRANMSSTICSIRFRRSFSSSSATTKGTSTPARPMTRDGNPVISREAVDRRDRMIEHLASLPPVQGALDQILHRFGTDLVAEVTGRSRRVVKRGDRLCVESRPASANFAETSAFMDDEKRILVFSDAGGTGRSYHADLGCRNQRRRIHYLLGARLARRCGDPGTRPLEPHQPEAAAGVPARRDRRQGREALSVDDRAPSRQFGCDHPRPAPDRRPGPVPRRRQSRKPLRQGGAAPVLPAASMQGRSRAARSVSFRTRPASISVDQDGSLKEELPPITQFLNRILALRIAMQNLLFAAFEELLEARIEAAVAAGTYDIGVETLTAESFRVVERRTVYTHAATGAETRCYRVAAQGP